MTNIHNLEDIATLSETLGLECKLAAGRDGKEQLYVDFWPTYSAFANSRGGSSCLACRKNRAVFLFGLFEVPMINKDQLEQLCLQRFCVSGYEYVYGPDIVHDGAAPELNDYQQVVLRGRVPAARSKPTIHIKESV